MNYRRHKEVLDRLLDKDGLLPTSELIVSRSQSGSPEFLLQKRPEIQVFPGALIDQVMGILLNDTTLWQSARVGMEAAPPIVGRVTIFGVSFQRAVGEALKQGHIKSKFQVPMPERFALRGAVAELVVHVGVEVEDGIRWATLEAWQDVGQSAEAFYVHARIDTIPGRFAHLDGATIQYDPEVKADLFRSAVKVKGQHYQKHFRLDGSIEASAAFEIAKAFFPIEELANEYFLGTVQEQSSDPTGVGYQRRAAAGGRSTGRGRFMRAGGARRG